MSRRAKTAWFLGGGAVLTWLTATLAWNILWAEASERALERRWDEEP